MRIVSLNNDYRQIHLVYVVQGSYNKTKVHYAALYPDSTAAYFMTVLCVQF